jgi:cysteine-rich repeat protein
MRPFLCLALVLVCIVGVTACFAPSSTACKTGVVCPEGTKCTLEGEQCVPVNSTCGDGLIEVGERCDDGNVRNGDGCRADCRGEARCGDGIIDNDVIGSNGNPLEVCDDENTDGGDGCSSDCLSTETCGNGVVDVTEQCDDGNVVAGDGCNPSCSGFEVCGDGYVDGPLRDGGAERCDDGNTLAGDSCAPDCQSSSTCGNGYIDINSDGGLPREQCEDGNARNDDGCTNLCLVAVCGDRIVRAGVEQCDEGAETASCNANCTQRRCGDGVVDVRSGEQCDVASVSGSDAGSETSTCDVDCTVAYCGDMTRNAARGEACDTGGPSATCNANCTLPRCGDSIVNVAAGEQCDEGTESAWCDSDCTRAQCGDARLNVTAGEQCDDGNSSNTDDCVTGCRTNVCGDGFRDQVGTRTEACDDGNRITETACAYGQATCTGCNAACTAPLALTGGVCGDGTVNLPNETCDDRNAASCGTCNATCTTLQPYLESRGTITTVSEAQINDGETVIINDGANPATVFCFRTATLTQCPGTQILVDLTGPGASSASAVADALIGAINSVGAPLAVTASKRATPPLVRLSHDVLGARGNQPLGETVSAPEFEVSGMKGGGGADCPTGTGCTSDADCSSGVCAMSRCQ